MLFKGRLGDPSSTSTGISLESDKNVALSNLG